VAQILRSCPEVLYLPGWTREGREADSEVGRSQLVYLRDDRGLFVVGIIVALVQHLVAHAEHPESSQCIVSHGAEFTGGAGFRSSADGSSGM